MKKLTISALLALAALSTNVNAQEANRFRIGWDFGVAIPKDGAGGAFSAEPRYNLQDNMSVGLKLGTAVMAKEIDFDNDLANDLDLDFEINLTRYYVGTFEYYFHNGGSFSPYLGGGLGVFQIDGIEVDDEILGEEIKYKFDNETEFGLLLRGGFELGKFRAGIEYFFIPETDIIDEGENIGVASNGFLNIHLGFFLGGGKWN